MAVTSSTLLVLHSPSKPPQAFTELLAEMRHSGTKCARTYLDMHSRADLGSLPLPWGRASQRQDFRRTSTTLQVPWRATETQQENSLELLPAAGEIRGGRVTTYLEQFLHFYRNKGVSMKPARGILVSFEPGILRSLTSCIQSWVVNVPGPPGSLLMGAKEEKTYNLPFVPLQFDA